MSVNRARPEQLDLAWALQRDAEDPLRSYRDQFLLPFAPDGGPAIYFCSHSLGLQPRSTGRLIQHELTSWGERGVLGHFHGELPWYTYQRWLREPAARLLGALPSEVILMNGLTINLHLMLTTFYRPSPGRSKILMDEPCFPSDLYAIKSQIQQHGLDPASELLTLGARPGEHLVREEDVDEFLQSRGSEVALVVWSGINFLTGQRFDLKRLAASARGQGCVMGVDLAHAAGNVPLELHSWDIDFAVWCTYKYLNSGPGAIGGCFVHDRHGQRTDLPRLAGWWGNDPETRFRMQLQPDFIPQPGAGGWQVSNPPILALAPIRASLELFDRVGMDALRAKSEMLSDFLYALLGEMGSERFEVVTPRDPSARGCQVSFLVRDRPRELLESLQRGGVIADFREPNFIRVAPVPFYNTFEEVWRFSEILRRHI